MFWPATRMFFGKKTRSRDGLSPRCKLCARRGGKEFYVKNRARRAEQTRAWKVRWPEVNAARDKKWYEENKDRKAESDRIRRSTEAGRALTRQRYQDNKEEAARKNRCYYLKNREYLLARSHQRYKDNPEPVKVGSRRYRARKFNANHEPYSTADINGIWHEQGGVCVYCQAPLFA